MAFSEDEIKQLIASGGYSPSKIPKLEEYLLQTCRGDAPFLFDGLRILIKLYALFPSKANATHMAYASLLTMINSPEDLLALQYLIPMPLQKDEPSRTIFACSNFLTACRYPEFWTSFESLQKSNDTYIQKMAQNAVPVFQQWVLETLALTYRDAPLAFVLKSLHASSLPADQKICSVSGDTVLFAATGDNTKRERVYQEGVSFEAVSSLLKKIAQ